MLARLIVGGQRSGTLVVEQGDIVLDDEAMPSGTPLNQLFADFRHNEDSVGNRLWRCRQRLVACRYIQ